MSDVKTISGSSNIKEIIEEYNIQVGDPMLFDNNSDGKPDHATIISKIDKEKGVIYYAAHTESRDYRDVKEFFSSVFNSSAMIIIISDKKNIYDEEDF